MLGRSSTRGGLRHSMLVIVGIVVVFGCVLAPTPCMAAILGVLWQPLGIRHHPGRRASAPSSSVQHQDRPKKAVGAGFKRALQGPPLQEGRLSSNCCRCSTSIFHLAKTKGMLALEQHVEKPDESTLFAQFPKVPARPPRGRVPVRLPAHDDAGHRESERGRNADRRRT